MLAVVIRELEDESRYVGVSGAVFSFVLAPLFLLHSKQELFQSPNRCVFSLKERDDREQKVQQFLDQLRVALIEFALFDAIDELLDLGRISGGDVIVVFHRRRSRRSYARQKRTPRPEHKYFLFSRGLTAGTLLGARSESAGCQASMLDVDARDGSAPVHWPFRQLENVLALQK